MFFSSQQDCIRLDEGHVLSRLHTVSAGRGSGKPLMLFLHGFPELWFSWRRQMEQFKEDFEVLSHGSTCEHDQSPPLQDFAPMRDLQCQDMESVNVLIVGV